MFEKLLNRIKNIVGTGIATRVETGIVQLKLATGIINDRIKRVHNYGFMSRPLPGAKAYTLFVGGDTSRGIAICIEDERYQMELEPGEVAVLDDKGSFIHLTEKGINVFTKQNVNVEALENVTVKCKNSEITADKNVINGETEINGNLSVSGEVTSKGDVVAAGISVDKLNSQKKGPVQ